MAPVPSTPASRSPPAGGLAAAMILIGLLLSAAIPLWLSGAMPTRVAGDQNQYHLPAIRTFAADWPAVDVRDYASATTPGYHLALAAVARYVDDHALTLQLAGCLLTVGLLATLGVTLARRGPPPAGPHAVPWAAVAMGLPLVASQYVLASGVWLLPDNAAWWGVLGVLVIALRGRVDRGSLIAGGLILAGLVLVRQNHVWAAGVLVFAWWLGPPDPTDDVLGHPPWSLRDARRLVPGMRGRAARAGRAALACVPAVVLLGVFVWLWGGLTPPRFQAVLRGGNAATPAFVLALLGVFGVFYAGVLWRPLQAMLIARPWVLGLAVSLAIVLAMLPPTTRDEAAGRWGALWNVAGALPTLGGRTSVLILVLAPVGMLALVGLLAGVSWRDRWVLVVALLGFTAAQSTSAMCWQRYIEPLLLMVMALAGARAHARLPAASRGEHLVRVIGPALLALLLAGVSGWVIARG